jgi:uncharacterized membrane protein YvlD (DUF360 family)
MSGRETIRADMPPIPDPPHEIRTRPPRFRGDPGDGPRVGLASYQLSDPEATFRLIERFRPQPAPRGPGIGSWALRILLIWSVNLVALAAAGLVVTNVGANDPFAYVAWAGVFGLVNASVPLSARLLRRPLAVLLAAVLMLGVCVALVWLMTVVVRPFHTPDLTAIAKAGAVMWLANLPLGVLYLRRGSPTAPRRPA